MSYGDPALQPWAVCEDQAEPIVRQAVEGGITFFDTADMYSSGASERITGRLLAKLFTERGDYVVSTKVFYPTGEGPNDQGLSRKHILAAIDASLRRLGTDHIDLYQVHRFDPATPVEETVQALNDLVRAGKVRYLGASAMYAWQFAKLQHCAITNGWTRFVSIQNRYNLVTREDERELLPMCIDMGVGSVPYSPLAKGLLAGTRDRAGRTYTARGAQTAIPDRAEDFDIQDTVRGIAQARGITPAQVALAWLLRQPAVCAPIVGATNVAHIQDAITAIDVKLSDKETVALESPYLPRLMSDYS
jgi:aryl-alcohol dehydrogenase-like predicted oxidoreductase